MPILVTTAVRRVRRMAAMTAAVLIVMAGCLSFASRASAAGFCGTNGAELVVGNVYSCTYTTAGEDTFNVPLFVTAVDIVAVGQTGGWGCSHEGLDQSGDPGLGARVAANLPVTQPTLFVEVPPGPVSPKICAPNQGTTLYGGGGGGKGTAPGGGASVVQRCSVNSVNSSCLLTGVPQNDQRLVVAGGGGGAGFDNFNGGNAGAGANPLCNPGQSGQGAPLGTLSGGGGSGGGCPSPSSGAAGGHGGLGPGGNSQSGFSHNGQNGQNGGLPTGGNGGAAAVDPVPVFGCSQAWPGAGGGSGFWGGGGGGGGASCYGGAGGGGSSYAAPAAVGVSMTLVPTRATPPSVTISWIKPVNREYQFLTGHAFGLYYTQSPPNPAFSATYSDTGIVQTSLTYNFVAPCVPFLNSQAGGTGTTLIASQVCARVVTTGGNQFVSSSIAVSKTGLLTLRIPGLPVVRAQNVLSISKTTCAGSKGATLISYLAVGSDVVISHLTAVAPNTLITVGELQLNLNVQTPFTAPADRGLFVDGIEFSFGGAPGAVTGHLMVASSESDIGDCPGQLPIS